MCVDYKKTKWAQDILKLQNEDGTWGNQFHSLALPSKRYPLTTEQAFVSGAYNHATYLSAYKNEFDSIYIPVKKELLG